MKKVLMLSLLAVAQSHSIDVSILNAPTFKEAVAVFAKQCAPEPLSEGQIKCLRTVYFSCIHKNIPLMDGPHIGREFAYNWSLANERIILGVYQKYPYVMVGNQQEIIDNTKRSMKEFFEKQFPQKFDTGNKELLIFWGVVTAVTAVAGYCAYKWVKNRKAQQDKSGL